MNTQEFYSDSKRLKYNPVNTISITRLGLRKLLAFDDRFVTVISELAKVLSQTRKNKFKVLDIGVGDGIYEAQLIKNFSQVADFYGIDISDKQLARSKGYLKEYKRVDFDKDKIPYKNNYFDVVIISEVLEHLFFPENILREANRVLSKGGFLFLTYPNSGAIQLRISIFLLGFSPLLNYSTNKEHIRFFNKKDILNIVLDELKIVKFQGLGSIYFDKWNFPVKFPVPRLFQLLVNRFMPSLALGNFVIFKK